MRKSAVYYGPGKSFGVAEEVLPRGTPVFFDGYSLNGEWAKILTYDGVEYWTPVFNITQEDVEIENEEQFRYNIEARKAMVSHVALQLGGGYGSRPMLTRAGGGVFWNFLPAGLVDFRYDQTEIGFTGSYSLMSDSVDPFFHGAFVLQWLYREGIKRRVLIGPRIGWAVMNDPDSTASFSHFLVGGLSFRWYWFEYAGIYMEVEVFTRGVTYVYGNGGLTIRF